MVTHTKRPDFLLLHSLHICCLLLPIQFTCIGADAQESLLRRRRREAAVKSAIIFYGIAGFAMAVACAAWVR